MEFRIYKYVDQPNEDNTVDTDMSFDSTLDSEEDMPLELEDGKDDSPIDNPNEIEDNDKEPEDENFQGIIRTVPGACLVYKRRDEKNTYEELWIYNAGGRDIKPEMKIRSSILAGTDVDPKTQRSSDGQQTAETISVGNVQFLHIKGLIN